MVFSVSSHLTLTLFFLLAVVIFSMPQLSASKCIQQQSDPESALKSLGFNDVQKLTDTLQGGIYRGSYSLNGSVQSMVMKTANLYLLQNGLASIDNKLIAVKEDILYEAVILKYLTQCIYCPPSIIKYHMFFQSYVLALFFSFVASNRH